MIRLWIMLAFAVVAHRRSESKMFNTTSDSYKLLVVASCTGPYVYAERAGFPSVFVEHEDVDGWMNAANLLREASRGA